MMLLLLRQQQLRQELGVGSFFRLPHVHAANYFVLSLFVVRSRWFNEQSSEQQQQQPLQSTCTFNHDTRLPT